MANTRRTRRFVLAPVDAAIAAQRRGAPAAVQATSAVGGRILLIFSPYIGLGAIAMVTRSKRLTAVTAVSGLPIAAAWCWAMRADPLTAGGNTTPALPKQSAGSPSPRARDDRPPQHRSA